MGLFSWIRGAAIDEAAAQNEAAGPPDPMRWPRRIAVLSLLVLGWVFILWQNRFHVTVPVVAVCLGYLAVVATVFNLWRAGAVAVAMSEDDERDSTWSSTRGELGELEREKKGLLRAIKEAEFDREMGKLSKQDSDEMIAVYRARAIEVIKEIDSLEIGAVGTVRQQIEREVKARLEIEGKTRTVAVAEAAKVEAKNKGKKGGKPQVQATAETAAAKAATALEKTSAAVKAAKKAVEVSTEASVPAEAAAAAKADADAALADAEAAMADATRAAAVADAAAEAVGEEPKADVKEATT